MTLSNARRGLCADCRWSRLVETKRGSAFLLCSLSKTDPRFPKYPPLPVRNCSGHVALTDVTDVTDATDLPESRRAL